MTFRLVALEATGFRAFSGTTRLDLDADAVIIEGANGQGKTSVFDAILWALAGRVPRVGKDADLVSLYSSSGGSRVVLDLRQADGTDCRVTRSFDGSQQLVRLEIGDQQVQGDSARSRLLELFWPEALATPDGAAALHASMTRGVYLQQDLVREFIETEKEQDRFATVSELVGAGRVAELQVQLDTARTGWTRVTNARQREAEAARERVGRLEAQVMALSASGEANAVGGRWAKWWTRAHELGVPEAQWPNPDAPDAATALDQTIRRLDAMVRTANRRRELATVLWQEARERQDTPPPNQDALRAGLQSSRDVEGEARKALADAEAHAAELRRVRVQVREARQELQTLAELALRQLGDRCPVCDQAYDRDATRVRLEELRAGSLEQPEPPSLDPDVSHLALQVEEAERGRIESERELRQAEEAAREQRVAAAEWRTRVDDFAGELGLTADIGTDASMLEALSDRSGETAGALEEHLREGEQLSFELAHAGEQARRAELQRELDSARAEAGRIDADLQARQRTANLAGQILDGLREAASDVVASELERMEPLLQRIYAAIDPHPSFRVVRFLTRFANRRGRVATSVEDPLFGLSSESPVSVLSSSQLNALAVSVFLAFNLGLRSLPIAAAMLDDPLQSMDDVNLLGLVDLLRRTMDRRQVLVSTHDSRFGRLLARKLRPAATGQRTRLIEFDAWSREGPAVHESEIPSDARVLRLAV